MAKIITVTLNTSIDHFIEVDDFEVGEVFKSSMNSLFPSGKGINVARTVEALGQEVTALGFVGESSQDFFNRIESSLLHTKLTTVQGATRTNVTVFDPQRETTTHIRNSGFSLSQDNLKEFEATLEQIIEEQDIVVISGSLPRGISQYTYKKIIQICHCSNSLVILDSSNESLQYGLAATPYMIKPNMHELQTLIGRELQDLESEIIMAAQDIACRQGILLVVVSRGEKGILVVDRDQQKVWKAFLPEDICFSKTMAVGSGDALVGGFATGFRENLQIQEIIRLGVACGAANLLSSEPGAIAKSDVEQLLPQVQIEQLL